MKKTVSLVILLTLIASLFYGCTGQGSPMAINDSRISEGVYAYYLSESKSREAVEDICLKNIAAENIMKKEGISLSANYKRIVAEETDKKWSMFSAYYESIGVTKQDLTTALTYEYNKKELLGYYYGDNGKKPVSHKKLMAEFDKTYVGFRAVEASYIRISDMGESVSFSDKEKSDLKKQFSSMAKSINGGSLTIDKANEKYNDSIGLIVTQTLETVIVKEGNVLYGDDFFKKISELKKGECAVIESGNSIYLLIRDDIATQDSEYFYLYKSEILEKIKMPDIEKKLLKESAEYTVKTNKSLMKDIEEKLIET